MVGGSLEAARKAGLVDQLRDGRIAFAHPLYGTAVYEAVPGEERRRTHRELAGLVSDVEERARHLALAATGPDEPVAAQLDRAAGPSLRGIRGREISNMSVVQLRC